MFDRAGLEYIVNITFIWSGKPKNSCDSRYCGDHSRYACVQSAQSIVAVIRYIEPLQSSISSGDRDYLY
jgi:hypothetical protein